MAITALETAIYSTLSTDSDLIAELGGMAIFNKRAPQGQALPYVVFQQAGGGDENETKHRTRNVLYQVLAVAATQAKAAAIDGYIDAALHLQSLTISGWSNFWMAREEDINIAQEDSGGVTRYHAGGTYRIRIEDT